MRHLFVSIGLLALGGIGGSLFGELPDNPPVHRGEWLVLEGDFHVHTRFSDGFLSPFEVVVFAQRQGLDVVGVTEHNMVFPAQLARWFTGLIEGPVVVVGEEITTRDHHLIALGLEETIPARLPLREAVARVHAQGGFVIGAHPVKRFWPSFESVAEELDGVEVMHPIAFRSGGEWSWKDMTDFYETHNAQGRGLTAIGSSDYHFFMALGVCRTIIFAHEPTAASVLEALRARRTVVYGPNGEAFGDPQLIALLASEPLPEKKKAPGYDATGARDAIARTLAWLGLLALIVIKRG